MFISGKCVCGQVTYKCDADPAFMGKCYCLDCSNESGTGHITTIAVPDAVFEVQGELSQYTKLSDDGNRLTKYFCTACGSTLFTRPDKLRGLVVVRAGTLDDRSVIAPQLQMYASRAPAWDRPDPAITSFPEMATAVRASRAVFTGRADTPKLGAGIRRTLGRLTLRNK